MVLSGIADFISPFGRLAMMIRWHFLGLDKMQWLALHIVFMVIFTVAGILHIFLNIKPIKAYLKNKARKMIVFTKEMSIALLITAVLFFATIYKFEPLEKFVKLNKSFNTYWIEQFKQERMKRFSKKP
jgi:ABC-type multidrug transport system fused ATPase/permease subunit